MGLPILPNPRLPRSQRVRDRWQRMKRVKERYRPFPFPPRGYIEKTLSIGVLDSPGDWSRAVYNFRDDCTLVYGDGEVTTEVDHFNMKVHIRFYPDKKK